MAITASLVKELRELTGAGMMDCKKVLTETDGNIEKAVDLLREKGLSKAAKKAGRIAAEGVSTIAISEDMKTGVVLEVNSETDFVAKNEEFVGFVNTVANLVLNNEYADVEALKAADYGDGKAVQEVLTEKIATIGENMSIRRFKKLSVENGAVVGYIHGAGKIAVITAVEAGNTTEQVVELGKDLSMQIAAMNPKYWTRDDVDQEYLAHEKEVLMAQAMNEGKPKEIVEKMVVGRLNKELKEVVLMDQVFVKDSDYTIAKLIEKVGKDAGTDVKFLDAVRFEVGDGLEKKEEDFAAEVAAQQAAAAK